MTTVMGAFAELERDLIRARTRDALASREASGVRLGRPTSLPESVRSSLPSAWLGEPLPPSQTP
jgi:DNA invertase Pin-like site-specific DNA recombinase